MNVKVIVSITLIYIKIQINFSTKINCTNFLCDIMTRQNVLKKFQMFDVMCILFGNGIFIIFEQ